VAKQAQHQEISGFVGGLVSEAPVLDFPQNAMKEGQNFVLNSDGSLDRRLGMGYEDSYALIGTSISTSEENPSVNSFRWRDVGGNSELEFLIVQSGNSLFIFDTGEEFLTRDGLLDTVTLSGVLNTDRCSFASVDGKVVIATGRATVSILSYVNGSFTLDSERLLVRDLWGVEDIFSVGGVTYNLREGSGLTLRPTSLTGTHEYNLRNQSFGKGRSNKNTESKDPLDESLTILNAYQSNADSVWLGLDADDVYDAEIMDKLQQGTSESANGSFIIDVLDRGSSRQAEINSLYLKESYDAVSLGLVKDSTPGGASTVEQFAGRVFYGGFSGIVDNGDTHSPILNSYVLFSRVVSSTADLNKCYQEGDPTSRDFAELLDDDGGFVRVSGMRTLLEMVQVGEVLLLIADNGVWALRGDSGDQFRGTAYTVQKVTDYGAISPDSVVEAGESIYYWSESGIISVERDQFGTYIASNISTGVIQSFFNDISEEGKNNSIGAFDRQDNTIRWVYKPDLSLSQTKELVLDLKLKAYYSISIESQGPEIKNIVAVPSYTRGITVDTITSEGVVVTEAGVPIEISSEARRPLLRSLKYISTISSGNNVSFTFSEYNNQSFKDWEEFDGIGVDAKAFLLTGATTVGQTNLMKQSPYLHNYFFRTEDGFEQDAEGNLIPLNPSSCKVRVQWDFSTGSVSNRWSSLYQAYRYKREYYASGTADTYDTGLELIMTKNKIRGRGKALSIYMETEPEKDCRIVGWTLSINGNAIG